MKPRFSLLSLPFPRMPLWADWPHGRGSPAGARRVMERYQGPGYTMVTFKHGRLQEEAAMKPHRDKESSP